MMPDNTSEATVCIKMWCDIFVCTKAKLIRSQPDGFKLYSLWIMILAEAGKHARSDGSLWVSDGLPYSAHTFQVMSDLPVSTIEMGLAVFVKIGIIEIQNNIIYIKDWGKYLIESLKAVKPQLLLEHPAQEAPKEMVQIVKQNHMASLLLEQDTTEKRREKERLKKQLYRDRKKQQNLTGKELKLSPLSPEVSPQLSSMSPGLSPEMSPLSTGGHGGHVHLARDNKQTEQKTEILKKQTEIQTNTTQNSKKPHEADVPFLSPLSTEMSTKGRSGHVPSDVHPMSQGHTLKEVEFVSCDIHQLLSGTPLEKISDLDIDILVKRYGVEKLLQAADVGAETWRRNREEIRNPGGYLNSLCGSINVPHWFVPYAKRIVQIKKAQRRQEDGKMEQSARQAEEDAQEEAVNILWSSLSRSQQEEYQERAIQSLPSCIQGKKHIPEMIISLAKGLVREERSVTQ